MKTIDPEVKEYVDLEISKLYTNIEVLGRELRGGISGLEGRMAGLDHKMDGLNLRIDGLDHKMDAVLNMTRFIVDEYRDLKRTYLDLRNHIDKRYDNLSDSIAELKRGSEGSTGFGQQRSSPT